MKHAMEEGDILMKEDLLLPKTLEIASEPCIPGWRLAKDIDGYEMGREVEKARWSFFSLAGEIKSSVFGTSVQSMTLRAVKRILTNAKSKQFNCLEITQIALKRFVGMRYLRMDAQSRQIQESSFLFSGEKTRSGLIRMTSIRTGTGRPTSTRGVAWEETNAKPSAGTATGL